MKINPNSPYAQKSNTTGNLYKEQAALSKDSCDDNDKGGKKQTLKYRLVGTMIKVMLVENGVEVSCVKSVPVEVAPPEMIGKIEDLTFMDLMMINDLKNKAKKPEVDNSHLPKEHVMYDKNTVYESDQ